jgi:hypothetical protein
VAVAACWLATVSGGLLFPSRSQVVALVLAAATLAVAACDTGTGRRVLVLLAVPALPFAAAMAPAIMTMGEAQDAVVLFLPPLVLAGLTAAALLRGRSRQPGQAAKR